MTWSLSSAQWRYCAKVGIAAALGYLITWGNFNQYAIYSAFTAALVVGSSVGEDLATSGNRVKGTIAGMVAAAIATALFGPSFWTVGICVALTALIALGLGWGIAVARIGVTIAIVTLAVHDTNAADYDLLRAANTVIGVVVGLAVSFFVWPVHGRDELERAVRDAERATRNVLDALGRGETRPRPLEVKLHDALAAIVKAVRDTQREEKTGHREEVDVPRVIEAMRLGMDCLSVALGKPEPGSLQSLRERLDHLASTIAK